MFDIDRAVDENMEGLVRDIKRLVAHYSVQGEPSEGKPFGDGPAEAVAEAEKIASELGFVTKNYDNYALTAEMGEGESLVGIIGHLDVVPVGEGWEHDPFSGEIVDGVMYGRGVTDDKGPSLAALYAMKIVRDSGLPVTKRVRFPFGANEETGMKGVAHYKEIEGEFDCGFTPDASFPLIFGEKGNYNARFFGVTSREGAKVAIKYFSGGMAANVVCDRVSLYAEMNGYAGELKERFAAYAEENEMGYTVREDEDDLVLTLQGVSAHASTPELGKNAISHMMRFVAGEKLFSCPFAEGYDRVIGLSYTGENCGVAISDVYGPLTFNVGIIGTNMDGTFATIDIRYPITTGDFGVYSEKMKEVFAESGLTLTETRIGPSLFIDPESPLVKKLYEAYVKGTGDTVNKPVTIGGGTYAKAFKNVVAFGPEFPGKEYNIHMNDEFMPLETLRTALKTYVYAIMALLEI